MAFANRKSNTAPVLSIFETNAIVRPSAMRASRTPDSESEASTVISCTDQMPCRVKCLWKKNWAHHFHDRGDTNCKNSHKILSTIIKYIIVLITRLQDNHCMTLGQEAFKCLNYCTCFWKKLKSKQCVSINPWTSTLIELPDIFRQFGIIY